MSNDLGVAELIEARRVARKAARKFLAKERAARNRGDDAAALRYMDAKAEALNDANEATELAQGALVNPTTAKVRKLTDATAKLEERLQQLRDSEEELNDLANVLRIFTSAIGLFRLL